MASRRTPDSSRPSKPASDKAPKASQPAQAAQPAPAKRVSKPKTPKAAAVPTKAQVSADTRRGMIAEAAYLRAERRGFAPGQEQEDWVAAEKEVDALLNANTGSGPQ